LPVPQHPHLLVSYVSAGLGPEVLRSYMFNRKGFQELFLSSNTEQRAWPEWYNYSCHRYFFPRLHSKLSIRPYLGSVCLTSQSKLKMLILHHFAFTASTPQLITFGERDNDWTPPKMDSVGGAH